MEKYSEQEKIGIFNYHVNLYNIHGDNKPTFGQSYNQYGFGVFISIGYNFISKYERYNCIIPLMLYKGEYIVGDYFKKLIIPDDIKNLIPKSEIERSVLGIKKIFGDNFEEMFEENRNLDTSNKAINKFKL